MNLVHPAIIAAAVGALVALAALVVAGIARSGALKGVMIAVAIAGMVPVGFLFAAMNPGLFDSRFRTYHAFYRDIEIGMTREQVLAAMERHYPTNGARMRPKIMNDTPEGLGFFMNPESSREPNCEGIFIGLQGARVSSVTYSGD